MGNSVVWNLNVTQRILGKTNMDPRTQERLVEVSELELRLGGTTTAELGMGVVSFECQIFHSMAQSSGH